MKIPIIAHGGAGSFDDIYEVINKTNIKGVAVASLFHYNNIIKGDLKKINIGNTLYLESVKQKHKNISIIKRLKKFLKSKKINVNL